MARAHKERNFGAGTKWDIDCNVTFPSTDEEEADRSPLDAAEGDTGDRDRVPVVVLLGWAGCKERNLAKYAAIYKKRCITIRYTAPTDDIFFKTDNIRRAANKILELIVDLNLSSNPIFIHSFSNGGGSVYRFISEFIHCQPEYRQMRLAGAIFDSAPGRRNIVREARVLLMTLNYPLAVKYLIMFLFVFYSFAMFWVSGILKILSPRSVASDYWSAIEEDPSTCPQLYLYSKADELISHVDIEDHMEARKRRAITVHSVCWPDSPHVAHLLKHRELYIKSCLDFLEFGLSYFQQV